MTLAASLFEMPHRDARSLLATGVPVYLCVNPVEYHGPHLSLHNDALVSAALARLLHDRLRRKHADWPFVTAGELTVGVAPTVGLGSRHASYTVAREIIGEACRALAELGARRVVLLTFHGAPLHNLAIHAGEETLRARGVTAVAPFHLVLRRLLDVRPSQFEEAVEHVADDRERTAMLSDLSTDFHAGFFETSMSLHVAPGSVSPIYQQLPPCPRVEPDSLWLNAAKLARVSGAATLASELTLAAYGLGWQALDPFPGYTGSPHRATARAGAIFTRYIVDAFETCVEGVFAGRTDPPKPIMAWTPALSANGRFIPGNHSLPYAEITPPVVRPA